LNLTSATLNAILKYPWGFQENPEKLKKWGCYRTEKDIFEWARSSFLPRARSVEAEIMDWADDITYAIHDMIDFYSAGLIPLHLLANQRKGGDLARREWEDFFDSTCAQKENREIAANRRTYEEALRSAFGLAGIEGPFTGSPEQSSTLWRFSSHLISRYSGALHLVDPARSGDGRCVEVGQAARDQVFKKAIEDKHWELFPVGFSELVRADQELGAARSAADYISGLTERQAYHLHGKLSGMV
jgi:dGTP triphosphohydrolase